MLLSYFRKFLFIVFCFVSFKGHFCFQVTQNLNCLSAWLILSGIQQVLTLTPATILERKDSTKGKGTDGGQKTRDGSTGKITGKRYLPSFFSKLKTVLRVSLTLWYSFLDFYYSFLFCLQMIYNWFWGYT